MKEDTQRNRLIWREGESVRDIEIRVEGGWEREKYVKIEKF